jgi:DNA-binding NarL/FixJ family response regulator
MSFRVTLQASDSLSATGIAHLLQGSAEVSVVPTAEHALADARIVVCDSLAGATGAALQAAAERFTNPVVLIADRIDDADLPLAARSRVVAALRRTDATADRLHRQVQLAAVRGGDLAPHLAEAVLRDALITRRGAMAPREREVLRLMADGLANAEIALAMQSSERSVKKVAHRIFTRHRLRNRPHAVAYAVRSGLI